MVKAELSIELQRKGCDTTKKRCPMAELVDSCHKMSIPLTVEEPEIEPGWARKPKGMSQILHERGHIDPTKSHTICTKNGRKEDIDEEGNLTEGGKKYCLAHLVENCRDFKEELNDLQHLAEELSSAHANNHALHSFCSKVPL